MRERNAMVELHVRERNVVVKLHVQERNAMGEPSMDTLHAQGAMGEPMHVPHMMEVVVL